MRKLKLLRPTAFFVAFLFLLLSETFAQGRTVNGTVTDQSGKGIPGVTVTVKGTTTSVQTDANGAYRITAPEDATLVFTSVGLEKMEMALANRTTFDATLASNNASLSEVVVIGYGTARRKDVTGAVTSVSARDFNKGVQISPDQLIQGKVAGVQILNNSGSPGGSVTVRIRGASSIRAGNQPLFVLDGIPLDNSSARPNAGGDLGFGGSFQGNNALNYINSVDIASMDVLKDASATAIYGSRGANGVVLITTKRGRSGVPRIELDAAAGVSTIMKKLKVLNAQQYRDGLARYNLGTANDGKADVDALDAILRTAKTQNYSVAVGAGTDAARYRISLGYLNQEGIVKKTDLKKYTANLNASFRFLESQRLGLDVFLLTSQVLDNAASISDNAGFRGSLIGQALGWNPTQPLRKPDGSLNVTIGGDIINPLAASEAYNDESRTTNILAGFSPSFKITKGLEYKMITSVNFGRGDRKQWIANFINFNDPRPVQRVVVKGSQGQDSVTNQGGLARLANAETKTLQVTNTLNYIKTVSSDLSINALAGMEYLKFDGRSNGMNAVGFPNVPYPYYNYFQATDQTQIRHEFGVSPTVELQSYFGRATFNWQDKYVLTATFRADGSSKFGTNNKYGYFPSFAAKWNLAKESFFRNNVTNDMAIRLGWGKTGNQEFPAGASQQRYNVTFGGISREQLENPDLKWETSTTFNAGVDFGLFRNRVYGSIDYFHKVTSDILFLQDAGDPTPPGGGRKWVNLPGEVVNSGVEVMLNTAIINQKNFTWDFGVNATFLKNELRNFTLALETGEINGQGLSNVRSQLFANNQPLNVFYLKTYNGINKTTNIPDIEDAKSFVGDPNPDVLLGINTRLNYNRFGLEVAMNGAFGHQIYNNTANAILTVNNISTNRNTTLAAVTSGESLASPIGASTRYLENGSYLKMSNATLSYRLGDIKFVRDASIYVTGQNLFVITKYSGFDPEVNTNKTFQDLPSFGIEYTPYPSARTILLGVRFSF